MEKTTRHKTEAQKEYMKKWRAKNAKKISAYMVEYRRKYRVENKEKLRERDKKYYEQNAERVKAGCRARYKLKREDRLKYNREYQARNKEAIKLQKKLYYEAHPHRIACMEKEKAERLRENCRNWHRSPNGRAYFKQYYAKKYSSDPQYRINLVLRSRVKTAFKRSHVVKSKTVEELLGCTPEQAQKHIESQWKDGMSWDNYGEWHIDHIVPVAYFDLAKEEEQRKAFHYTNLQPLWAHQNLQKHARLVTLLP